MYPLAVAAAPLPTATYAVDVLTVPLLMVTTAGPGGVVNKTVLAVPMVACPVTSGTWLPYMNVVMTEGKLMESWLWVKPGGSGSPDRGPRAPVLEMPTPSSQ